MGDGSCRFGGAVVSFLHWRLEKGSTRMGGWGRLEQLECWMDSYMGSKWTDSYMGCEWTALSLS